jgi:hypothetical protein
VKAAGFGGLCCLLLARYLLLAEVSGLAGDLVEALDALLDGRWVLKARRS